MALGLGSNNIYPFDLRPNYTIQVTIDMDDGEQIDFTPNVESLKIVTSARTRYQLFLLKLRLRSEWIISREQDFFKRNPISVSLINTSSNAEELARLNFNLSCYELDGINMSGTRSDSMPSEEDLENANVTETISLLCIPTKSYIYMGSTINSTNFQGLSTPIEVLDNILSQPPFNDLETEIDRDVLKETPIRRNFTIPHGSLAKFFNYITEDSFDGPLYLGPTIAYIDHNGKLIVTNLLSRLKKDIDYKVKIISPGRKEARQEIENDLELYNQEFKDIFWTTTPVITEQRASKYYAKYGANQKYIVTCDDTLTNNIRVEIRHDDIPDSILDKEDTIKNIEGGGTLENSVSWVESRVLHNLSTGLEVDIFIDDVYNPTNLLKLGATVEIEGDNDHIKYTGKFVVMAYDIIFKRGYNAGEVFETGAVLRCFRPVGEEVSIYYNNETKSINLKDYIINGFNFGNLT